MVHQPAKATTQSGGDLSKSGEYHHKHAYATPQCNPPIIVTILGANHMGSNSVRYVHIGLSKLSRCVYSLEDARCTVYEDEER